MLDENVGRLDKLQAKVSKSSTINYCTPSEMLSVAKQNLPRHNTKTKQMIQTMATMLVVKN